MMKKACQEEHYKASVSKYFLIFWYGGKIFHMSSISDKPKKITRKKKYKT